MPIADIHLLWALAISAELSPVKIGRTVFSSSTKKSNSARTRRARQSQHRVRRNPRRRLARLRPHRKTAVALLTRQHLSHGGFSAFAGRPLQLVVRNDTVEGVTFFDTHQLVPGPYTFWLTIDGLFEEAVSAAGGRQLTAISFDPLLSYPTRMNFIPRPDVSSSIEATDLSSATPR